MSTNDNNEINDNYDIGIFDPNGKKINPLNGLEYSDQYKVLAKMWSNLPAYKNIRELVESIKKNDIVLIHL
jgi:hypothetical protein